jgi:HSP20 family molecular chaperone IbpA
MSIKYIILVLCLVIVSINCVQISVNSVGSQEVIPKVAQIKSAEDVADVKKDEKALVKVEAKPKDDVVKRAPILRDLWNTGSEEEDEDLFHWIHKRMNNRFHPGVFLLRGPALFDEEIARPCNVRVTENKDEYILDLVNIPAGYKKDSFKVDVQTSPYDDNKDVLIIKGTAGSAEMVKEFAFGKSRINRSGIKAQFKDQILSVRVPKKPLEVVNVKIE